MTPAPVMLGIADFPGEKHAIAQARHYVRGLLDGGRSAEDAELLTSELVTNAYKYTQSRHGTITVIVLDLGQALRIEVIDEGGADTIPEVHADPYAVAGRGLYLVEHIATTWGTREDEAGRSTWCEVPHSHL